jgi:hypothetical protein
MKAPEQFPDLSDGLEKAGQAIADAARVLGPAIRRFIEAGVAAELEIRSQLEKLRK